MLHSNSRIEAGRGWLCDADLAGRRSDFCGQIPFQKNFEKSFRVDWVRLDKSCRNLPHTLVRHRRQCWKATLRNLLCGLKLARFVPTTVLAHQLSTGWAKIARPLRIATFRDSCGDCVHQSKCANYGEDLSFIEVCTVDTVDYSHLQHDSALLGLYFGLGARSLVDCNLAERPGCPLQKLVDLWGQVECCCHISFHIDNQEP